MFKDSNTTESLIGKISHWNRLVFQRILIQIPLFPLGFVVLFLTLCMPQSKSSYDHEKEYMQITLADSNIFFIRDAFEKRNLNGCFILYDLRKDEWLVYNALRADSAYLPASTFKIANSLIALECKAIHDENEIIKWDKEQREVPAWNTDHSMRTAFRYSAVWFYQELARRIGQKQMQEWLHKMHYGNEIAGPGIDEFWLRGELRITPRQQVEFLKLLILEELPVKKKNMEILKDIMIENRSDEYILRGKTGWAISGKPVGWYVGWLQFRDSEFIFVNNLDIWNEDEARFRKEITHEILNQIFELNAGILQ